jgi:hypothetical protein
MERQALETQEILDLVEVVEEEELLLGTMVELEVTQAPVAVVEVQEITKEIQGVVDQEEVLVVLMSEPQEILEMLEQLLLL